MPHAPRIPNEQRSFADGRGAAVVDAPLGDRHDSAIGARSKPSGAAGPGLGDPDWFGDLRQSLTTHWMVQQR